MALIWLELIDMADNVVAGSRSNRPSVDVNCLRLRSCVAHAGAAMEL